MLLAHKILLYLLILLFAFSCSGFVKVSDVEYTSGLLLDLYLPDGGTNNPVIICVRGGGWQCGDKEQMAEMAQTFSDNGFVGVSIEYSESPEYTFPTQFYDVCDAVRFIRDNAETWGIDPNKIGLYGNSAGGHLVSLVAAYNNPFVSCAVSKSGVYDLVSGLDYGSEEQIEKAILFIGCTYEDCPKRWKNASPVNWATLNSAPLLMIHGFEDETVSVKQVNEMLKKCSQTNANAIAIVYANDAHGVPQLDINIVISFFAENLKE